MFKTVRKTLLLLVAVVVLLLCSVSISYEPHRAPVLNPADAVFPFDPNLCPSPAIRAVVIYVGVTYNGQMVVTEPEGEKVKFTAAKITIYPNPVSSVIDANDQDPTDGLAMIFTYDWSWTPTLADAGINYINVKVADPIGGPKHEDERTFVLLVVENLGPAFTNAW